MLGTLIFGVLAEAPLASAAPVAVGQCNADTFPTGAGFEVTCYVTVLNTMTASGATSSSVTTTECLAGAGVPYPSCTTAPTPNGPVVTVTNSTQLVNSVTQCNGIVTGGGSNVICHVEITNDVPVGTASSALTVNQCNNAATTTEQCNPYPASTTGASVTQCNGSGGAGTYVGTYSVQCTAVGGASALPLSVNQCNGTATGGGSSVTCTVSVANVFEQVAPPVTTPPVTTPPGTTPPVTTPPGTTPPVTTPPGTTPPVTTAPGNTTGGIAVAAASSGASSSSGTGPSSGTSGTVLPTGAPQTGFGGAARSGDDGLLIVLGAVALFGALAAGGLAVRRRRSPVALGKTDLDGG